MMNSVGKCDWCGLEIRKEFNIWKADNKIFDSSICAKKYKRNINPSGALAYFGVGLRYLECRKSDIPKEIYFPTDNELEFNENIFITGSAGTGKTYLAVCYIHKVMLMLRTILFRNVTTILFELKNGIKQGFESQIIDKYVDVDLLVLDDLGAEKTTEYVQQSLYCILNLRYENCKQTIITSNLGSKELSEYYGYRMLSRIGSGRIIKLDGKDKRLVSSNV